MVSLALNRTIYQIEMMPEKSITCSKRWTLCAAWLIPTDDDIAAFRKSAHVHTVSPLFR
ncbi:hypothetical protein ACVXG9_10155 [Escherichia coli]